MIQLIAVRHGQSTWNVAGRVQGQAPGPVLTDLGRTQAELAAEQVRELGARRLISSDQDRARQTAAIIAAATGLAVETAPALREQALGFLEGQLSRDLRPLPVPPGAHLNEIGWGGGESMARVYRRMADLVAALPGPGPVILVTHEGPIQVLRALSRGQGHRELDWTPVAHGAVIRLTVAVAPPG